MTYLICCECKKKSLEVTTPAKLEKMKKDKSYPANSAVARMSPELIGEILGLITLVAKYFINKNKTVVVCHSCGLYMNENEYKSKYNSKNNKN